MQTLHGHRLVNRISLPRGRALNGPRRPVQARAQLSTSCPEAPENSRQQVEYSREAVLCKRAKAHNGALTAALVLVDEHDRKQVVTASLDKTLATWDVEGCGLEGSTLKVRRLEVPGAPVFSLAHAPARSPSQAASGGAPSSSGRDGATGRIWCGLAAKEIVALDAARLELSDKQTVRMNGHTGWVRSLAPSGKYLFSCGCNHLRQWDTTFTTPKELLHASKGGAGAAGAVSLFTGDILAITTGGGRVFTAGADGSLHSWAVGKTGELTGGVSRERAHNGQRATALAWHKGAGLLYSVSYDGTIKAWDGESLQLVLEVKAAHKGERVLCCVVGADGMLYTGGDDRMVRRWNAQLLVEAAGPLAGHGASVRVLAAGPKECLVSGDASGDIAIWSL